MTDIEVVKLMQPKCCKTDLVTYSFLNETFWSKLRINEIRFISCTPDVQGIQIDPIS